MRQRLRLAGRPVQLRHHRALLYQLKGELSKRLMAVVHAAVV